MGYRAGVLQVPSPCRIPQFFSPGCGLDPDQEQVDGLLEPEGQGEDGDLATQMLDSGKAGIFILFEYSFCGFNLQCHPRKKSCLLGSLTESAPSSCKICGGKPVVNGNMLGNLDLEVSRVIDPQLNWRTASKGKPRAVRRARTSFTSIIERKPLEKGRAEREDLIKEPKRSRAMPVSESEKVGVAILGQRFGDAIESVPIKKRRFLFRSPSPPPSTPLVKEEAVSRQSGTGQEPNTRHGSLKNYKSGIAGDIIIADRKVNLNDVEEESGESVDFSGISILAAAACDSSSADDGLSTESLDSKQCQLKRDSSSLQIGSENKLIEGKTFSVSDVLDGEMNTHLVEAGKFSPQGCDAANNKSTSHLMEDSLSSPFIAPSHNVNGSSGGTGSSRDERLHWDLNTVMEAWESPFRPALTDSQPAASNASSEEKVPKQESREEKAMESCSQTLEKNMDKAEVLLERPKSCATVPLPETAEKANISSYIGPSGECPLPEFPPNPMRDSVLADVCASEEEKADPNNLGLHSLTESQTNLHANGGTDGAHLPCMTEQQPTSVVISIETIFKEKASTGSGVDFCESSDECGSVDVRTYETMKADEMVGDPGQDAGRADGGDVVPSFPKDSDIMNNLDQSKMATDEEKTPGDAEQMEAPSEVKSETVDQPTESRSDACRSESFVLAPCGFSNREETLGGCIAENERANLEPRLKDASIILTYEDQDAVQPDHPTYVDSKDSTAPNTVIGPPPMDAPDDMDKGSGGNLGDNPGEIARDGHSDSESYSDVSQHEQVGEIEKVEQVADDESQYEDGEFRESSVHGWETDGCDDGEAEHVDYGSDNRETNNFESVPDYPASNIPSQVDESFDGDSGGRVEAAHPPEEPNLGEQMAEHRNVSSSASTDSDIETSYKRMASVVKKSPSVGHSTRRYVINKWEKSTRDASDAAGLPNEKVMEKKEFVVAGDGARWIRSASFRVKASGWDRLPGGRRSSGDGAAVADSRVDASEGSFSDIPSRGISAEDSARMAGSTFRRELVSQVGRHKMPDMPLRKDRAYFQGTRNPDHSDNMRHGIEQGAELGRSIRRDGSSVRMRCRGKGDRWVESSRRQGPDRQDSSGYFNHSGFTLPGSKDAAAVSIAKVESNGFVVAPDGTVLEASSAGPSVLPPQRSANSSSPSGCHALRCRGSPLAERDELDLGPPREMSIGLGRPSKYRPKIVGKGNRDRYGFIPDDGVGPSLVAQHPPFSRRDRSFSPPARPPPPVQLSRSHTRSQSRSRSHSPHGWASPRRRSGAISNGVRQRRSRSPPDFRVGRARSPHGVRLSFGERTGGFAPSPRVRASPPLRASRWVDERKGPAEQRFPDGDHRRYPGRNQSPPKKLLSRRHTRFNLVDSQDGLKPDEFYRPIEPDRFPAFGGGGGGDRRQAGDGRYEIHPSARRYDIAGDAKRARYEAEEDFRRPGSHAKDGGPNFPEREAPRGFATRGSTAKAEMAHFRYNGRDDKDKMGFKSYSLRECDSGGGGGDKPRRRRHS
ncbi:unnamed protein product [Spirodela intermedia]|uniref:Uncharacterized protein n=1 Tax=Spirodela intermedia TaxID=51605 RepID=A0A7I8L165_SPIIN|nr:unnamed protein product [Spirodela intermedia]